MALNCCDSKARIDALMREVAFFKDAAAAFCADLMHVESELDALKAAQRKPLAVVEMDQLVFNCGLSATPMDIARAIESAYQIKEPA